MRAALFVAVLVTALALPLSGSAQGPMIEIELTCDSGIGDVTVLSNPVYLWVPGHVATSDDGLVTHIVTSIFGETKGATNAALADRIVTCIVASGPLAGLPVEGFFVPRH